MKEVTLIVKPVSTVCNLACGYCYHGVQPGDEEKPKNAKRMTLELLGRVIRDCSLLDQRNIHFLWHGGEPTIAGLGFFRKAMSFQHEFLYQRKSVRNSIQTNAFALSRKWVSFFKENRFHVGVSLDGPKNVHNKNRRNRLGKETFGEVFANILRFLSAGLPIGVVCAVTSSTSGDAASLLGFFVKHGIRSVNFSPVADMLPSGELAQYSITPEEWGVFLVQLFNEWITIDRKIGVQFLDNLLQACFGASPSLCVLSRGCDRFISIDADGKVYVCGRFLGNENFFVGDLTNNSLREILNSDRYTSVIQGVVRIPETCSNCELLNVCNCGCAYYRFMNGASTNDPYFCESMKILIPHVKKTLRQVGVLDRTIWRKQNN